MTHAIKSTCNLVCAAYFARLLSSLFQLSLCVSSELSQFGVKALYSWHPHLGVDTAEGKEFGKCRREIPGDRQKLKTSIHISLEKE